MNENTPNNTQTRPEKSKKKAKITPKAIFGIFCGTSFLFILSFVLSFILMNHDFTKDGEADLKKENAELKSQIELLETQLQQYENNNNDSAKVVQPDASKDYTGSAITPGGGSPLSNKSTNDKNESTDSDNDSDSADKSTNNDKKSNNKNKTNNDESAFEGIITDDDETPASTGISDAPVTLN